jgi:hypothetical protein
MQAIRLNLIVASDGVLTARIPLGVKFAGTSVTITIESEATTSDAADAKWRRALNHTYGACACLGLERPEQLLLEERDEIE